MLWNIWHCVLGWILIWRSKKWEAPVMMVVSFAQVCIATMLLGIYFFGAKVGGDPFALLRMSCRRRYLQIRLFAIAEDL
jgi:cytochrome c-type biogenesis protein CcmF